MREAQNPREQIARYLRLNFYKIEGYMDRFDASLYQELIVAQIKNGNVGSLVEIGGSLRPLFFCTWIGTFWNGKELGCGSVLR
jgi:hypothetical protein